MEKSLGSLSLLSFSVGKPKFASACLNDRSGATKHIACRWMDSSFSDCSAQGVQRQGPHPILPDMNHLEALSTTGLQTLEQRRVERCRRFAVQLRENPTFCDWLPPNRGRCHEHNLRNRHKLSGQNKATSVLPNFILHNPSKSVARTWNVYTERYFVSLNFNRSIHQTIYLPYLLAITYSQCDIMFF